MKVETMQINMAKIKNDLLSGVCSAFDLACAISEARKGEDRVFAAGFIKNLLQEKKITMELVPAIQWIHILMQAWLRDKTFLYTLENYIYPAPLPNLTKDKTKDFELRHHKNGVPYLYNTQYQEQQSLLFHAIENEQKILLDFRFAVLPNGKILMFD